MQDLSADRGESLLPHYVVVSTEMHKVNSALVGLS